jgi:hypothetical protein
VPSELLSYAKGVLVAMPEKLVLNTRCEMAAEKDVIAAHER